MTKSLYIVGGAGTGKSTFMGQLLDRIADQRGELGDLHARRNAKALVTLRGHQILHVNGRKGMYLGRLREHFPGTDGLDRASSATAVEWLQNNGCSGFYFIIGEGATLATRPFLFELADHTDMLLLHLETEDWVKELRFLERGSNQDPRFIEATTTRSRNLLRDMEKRECVTTYSFDSAYPDEWDAALKECRNWLS